MSSSYTPDLPGVESTQVPSNIVCIYICGCISISKQCSVLCDIRRMDICTRDAAIFSLKNDCFRRVVLCWFAFLTIS